jgi:myo-inositol-1(or 4)-monophosphatase
MKSNRTREGSNKVAFGSTPSRTLNLRQALTVAVAAARKVGALMRRELHAPKHANEVTQHDIKLELDVRSQKLIERTLHRSFPGTALLGEEGITGDPGADYRWVVDPIDGTVNFTYSIPHACVSIALQARAAKPVPGGYSDSYETLVGVVYDPFCNELWTAIRGQPARLNGKTIRVSNHTKLEEAIVSLGFAKSRESLEATLPLFLDLVHRVRKIRMMGAAALALTYVATGRFDAYIERGIRLWDIAAGGLILECAGGEFCREAVKGDYTYRMVATNGRVRRHLRLLPEK